MKRILEITKEGRVLWTMPDATFECVQIDTCKGWVSIGAVLAKWGHVPPYPFEKRVTRREMPSTIDSLRGITWKEMYIHNAVDLSREEIDFLNSHKR